MIWALMLRHWRGFAAGFVIISLLVGVWVYGNHRFNQGKTVGKTEQTEQDTQIFKAAIAQRDALLQQSNAELLAANARAEQFARTSAALADKLTSIKLQADKATADVARLSDSQLFSDVRGRVGQVNPSDTQPFTAGELRTIDTAVTLNPLLTQQVGNLTETVKAKDGQIDALIKAGESIKQQRDAWQQYSATVDQLYVRAYNSLEHRKRAGKCLWLWKCLDRKLNFPIPTSIVRPQ